MISFPDVQSYLTFCAQPDAKGRFRPPLCNACGRLHPLRIHDQYEREVWSASQVYRITVFRFLCGACEKVVSALSSFVGRYQRSAWDVQEEVLLAHEEGRSLEQAGETILPPAGPLSARTVWRWHKAWKDRMHSVESAFWACVLSADPAVVLPRGPARSPSPIRRWLTVWKQVAPMGTAMGLLHGLFCLRQSSASLAD